MIKIISNGILFVAIMILIAAPTSAQRFSAGILLGGNLNRINGLINSGYKQLGFQAGLFVWTRIKVNGFMRIEIKYSQKGNNSIPDSDNDYEIVSRYIETPFLLGYNLPRNLLGLKFSQKLFLMTGFSVGYLVNYSEKFGFTQRPMNTPNAINKYEIAGHVGFGFKILKSVSAEVRYSSSIIPIRKYSDNYIYINGNQYNNVLSGLLTFDIN